MGSLSTGQNGGWQSDGTFLVSDPTGVSNQEAMTNGFFYNTYTLLPVVSKTANYSVPDTDQPGAYGVYLIDCTANTFTVTLPNSSSINRYRPWIVVNSGSGTITVTTVGGTQIVGNDSVTVSQTLPPGGALTFHSTGTKYLIY